MKKPHPTLLTLLLAHIAGSYSAYLPTLILFFQGHEPNPQGLWIISLAPICTPIYLALTTITDFPHYYSTLPQVWACYTIPFLIICLLRRRKSPFLRLAFLPVIITLLVTAFWLPRGYAESRPWRSPLIDKPAPDFTLTTLAGDTRTLSQEKGHVILIDFWATTCPPCRAELKQTIAGLANDNKLYDLGLRVWAVNVMDNPDTTRKFIDDNHYNFTVLLDTPGAVAKLYPLQGIPTVYLVARNGSVRSAFVGFDPDNPHQIRDEIEAALK
ncbi:MAG TPA: TlpA disulfide reductase family protein [Tepidisphaeraceae bacterium]|jgi:peroxiredoxin|nr:TlpA disulfide reductase family protein [Tepidisphaeraceae bacterium]